MSARTTVKSIQDIMRQDVGVDGDAQRLSQLCWMFFLKIIDDQDQELEVMQDNYRSPIPESLQWRNWGADPEGITGDALLAFAASGGTLVVATHDETLMARLGRVVDLSSNWLLRVGAANAPKMP